MTATTITGAGAGTGVYTYDGLGRTSSLPAIDTNNPGGDNLSLGFYSTDKVASQTVGASTQTFGLDPTGRADTTTTTTATGSTTTSSFFDGGSDSPAWTSTSGGTWTRFIDGPGGSLALQATGTGSGASPTSANLMLINPHGDITATIPNTLNVPAAQVSGINDTDEYGVVLSTPAPSPYGWVGAAQRSTADQGGLILMGARQYNPASGRFLTLDPTPGGNPNPYTYPVDPVNGYDLSGQWPDWGAIFNNVIAAVAAPIRAVVNIARAVIHTVASAARTAYRAVRSAVRRVTSGRGSTRSGGGKGSMVGVTFAAPATAQSPGGDGIADWFVNRNWGHVASAVAMADEGTGAIGAGIGLIAYGAGRGLTDDTGGGAAIAAGVGAIIFGQFMIFGSAVDAYRGFNEPCPKDGCGPISQIGEFWDRTLSGFSFRRPELG